jgi:hypothetical protein
MSILYVDCKKFPTNWFVGNFCSYNSVIFFCITQSNKKLLNKHNTLKNHHTTYKKQPYETLSHHHFLEFNVKFTKDKISNLNEK